MKASDPPNCLRQRSIGYTSSGLMNPTISLFVTTIGALPARACTRQSPVLKADVWCRTKKSPSEASLEGLLVNQHQLIARFAFSRLSGYTVRNKSPVFRFALGHNHGDVRSIGASSKVLPSTQAQAPQAPCPGRRAAGEYNEQGACGSFFAPVLLWRGPEAGRAALKPVPCRPPRTPRIERVGYSYPSQSIGVSSNVLPSTIGFSSLSSRPNQHPNARLGERTHIRGRIVICEQPRQIAPTVAHEIIAHIQLAVSPAC